jgi:hypothetical protein
MFGRNVCGRERSNRFLIGILVVAIGIFYTSWLTGIVGIMVLSTAIFSYCPINKALGRDSCSLLDRMPLV